MAADVNRKPRLDERPGDGALRSTTRMEAFADAVFAIAFTLPVVELKLPPAGPEYGARLLALWPSYLGMVLAGLVIAIYWVHHHFAGAIFRTAGHRFLLATLLFLLAVGFIAFPTRAFSEHITDAHSRTVGALVYSVSLSGTAVAWWIKWRTGRRCGDVDKRLDPDYVARLGGRYDISTLLMVAAIPLALWQPEAGLVLSGAVTLWYLRAPETPVYRDRSPPIDDDA